MQNVEPTPEVGGVKKDMELPLKADRVNKLLSFDSDGLPAATVSSTALSLISSGTGTPEGSVTASVGSIFLRTDGGSNTSFYVKESGSGNTGWVAK